MQGLQFLFGSPLKSHGRLKSSNVVVDKRWSCKLTDYGMSLFKGGQTDYQAESEHDMYKGGRGTSHGPAARPAALTARHALRCHTAWLTHNEVGVSHTEAGMTPTWAGMPHNEAGLVHHDV